MLGMHENAEKYENLKGVKWRHCSFKQGEKLPCQETLDFPPTIFFLTWPFLEREPPPSGPAGRKGWLLPIKWHYGKGEGVTAIEVTQWLELQDTVKQEDTGSSNPWNPDLLKKIPAKQQTLQEPRGRPPTGVTRILGFGKSATWFLHWQW